MELKMVSLVMIMKIFLVEKEKIIDMLMDQLLFHLFDEKNIEEIILQ
jgi:hypothetical protein